MLRVLSFLLVLIASASALVVTPGRHVAVPRAAAASSVQMGPAKDGPFTPFVLGAKLVLGEQTLLKYRGKVISIHSQIIGEFCDDFGVPKQMKAALIKKAKFVGSDLGFLS